MNNRETHERHEKILFANSLERGLLVNFGSYPQIEIIHTNSHFRDFSAFRGSKKAG